jgi:hypothetical protein
VAFPHWVKKGRQLLRLAWKNLLRDRTPTLPIADMRQVVAAIDDRLRQSGGGGIFSNQTGALAAVASSMGQVQTQTLATNLHERANATKLHHISPGLVGVANLQ